MAQSWDMFLDEVDGDVINACPLLPSSMNDVWNEKEPEENHNENYGININEIPKRSRSIPPPMTTPHPISSQPDAPVTDYCFVQFHPYRTLLVKNTQKIPLEDNDYVITEADRGFDLGRIVKIEMHPLEKDAITARSIVRKASQHEIAMIASKEEKENNARNVCQEKANELGLPMKVTATELQYDGKKLTVYFSANQYIDFRNLVHTLFRVFGTRIWMVWFDGSAPVRDVFTHHARDRRLTME